MALSILDGTQTATTLSTILSSGQHITAHTVVSLGTQAKTDILSAVSSGIAISGTVTANLYAGEFAVAGIATDEGGTEPINGVQLGYFDAVTDGFLFVKPSQPLPISGTVTIGSALPAGTNRIGVVTIGGGTVTIGAGTAQIGSVTASISGTVPVSGTFFQTTQPVSLATLPTLAAGTAQIGSVTASISNTVPISISSVTVGNSVTIGSLPAISGTVTASLAISSTAITSGSFASLTSATLVPGDTTRKMATIFNQGAGQLFVNAGATATTAAGGFMVALSSGDFFECNYTTTTLSAIFATAGTASWMSH